MKTFLLALIVALSALLSLGCHCDEIDCYLGSVPHYTVTSGGKSWTHVRHIANLGNSLSLITEDNREVILPIQSPFTIEEEKEVTK